MKPCILSVLILAGFMRVAAHAYDDLTILSDEFDVSHTVTNWHRIYQVEGWGNDVLETFDINTSRASRMFMRPYTSSWYAEWRGELTFKYVTGDFVVTTDVEPRNRAGTGAPGSLYSLAGIMVRTPRTMTNAAQWLPQGQNYVFLSLGSADNPGTYQYEVKTTIDSQSSLSITPGPSRATIQVARIGPYLIMLRRDQGGPWTVHRRYYRPDMPQTLQVGLTVYTDWAVCDSAGYPYQNQFVLTNGLRLPNNIVVTDCNPDLDAAFDYVRYARPQVPANLIGADLSSPSVGDQQLLSFLGAAPNVPGGAATPTRLVEPEFVASSGFNATLEIETNRTYRVQAGVQIGHWQTLTNIISTTNRLRFTDPTATNSSHKLYRVVSP